MKPSEKFMKPVVVTVLVVKVVEDLSGFFVVGSSPSADGGRPLCENRRK